MVRLRFNTCECLSWLSLQSYLRAAAGNVVLDASPMLTYTASGAGAIYGVGNGDPADHTPDKVGFPDLPYGGVWARAAFNGLARAVVQSTTTPGSILVTVSSPGLTSGSTTITTA